MDRILYVDDDLGILEAVKRQYRKTFDIVTGQEGATGLEVLQREGPFAVVLSDLRMPGMDGVQFLSRVRELSPDTVRIMLTGNADLDAAVHAVNEGNIFRFLTKPCPSEMLAKAIQAGIDQYRLVTAERELLEKTLNGSVKVLTDILALANPVAFGRASRVKDYAQQIAEKLKLKNRWQMDLAAMLSQIGCITIPPDTLEKRYRGEVLSPEESSMFQSHPGIGSNLICSIPRLDVVAEIIALQDRRFDGSDAQEKQNTGRDIPLEARALKAVLDFDTLLASGATKGQALLSMRKRTGWYDPQVLGALSELSVIEQTTIRRSLQVRELLPHMILAEDLKSKNGLLLASKGQPVTPSLKERLKNFVLRGDVGGEIAVLIRSAEPARMGAAEAKGWPVPP